MANPVKILKELTPDQEIELNKAMRRPDIPENQEVLEAAESNGYIEITGELKRTEIKDPVSKTESFLRGAGQGATLGFQDELSAVAEKGIAGVDKMIRGAIGKPTDVAESVLKTPTEKLIEENRAINEAAAKVNPKSYISGGLVGALPGGIALSAAAPATITGQGLVGAALGGGQALGGTEKLGDVEAVEDVLKGMGFGGALGMGGAAISKVAEPFKKLSLNLGRRATGMIKSVVNKAGGPKNVDDAVRVLLENKAIKGSLGKIADNVEQLREEAGKVIGNTLKQLDDAGVKGVFKANKLANSLKSQNMRGTNLTVQEFMDLPINSGIKNQFDEIIATAKAPSFADETFQSAQSFKNVLKEKINFAKDGAERNLYLRAYLTVRDFIDDAVLKSAPNVKDPNIAKNFQKAKDIYKAAMTAEKGIDSELRRASGNRILSLTDWVTFAGRDPLTGAGMVLGKKLLESNRALGLGARMLRGTGIAAETVGKPVGRVVTGESGGLVGAIQGE